MDQLKPSRSACVRLKQQARKASREFELSAVQCCVIAGGWLLLQQGYNLPPDISWFCVFLICVCFVGWLCCRGRERTYQRWLAMHDAERTFSRMTQERKPLTAFVSRPKEIRAAQYREGENWPPGALLGETGKPYVITIHGNHCPLEDGDWVVQEPDGEHYYPVHPDVFAKSYDPVCS